MLIFFQRNSLIIKLKMNNKVHTLVKFDKNYKALQKIKMDFTFTIMNKCESGCAVQKN